MSEDRRKLLSRLDEKTAVIGVAGIEYVGLPLFLRFSGAGYRVIGFDIDQAKVDKLNAVTSYLSYYGDALVAASVAHGASATADFAWAAEADAFIISVPTPLDEYRSRT